MSGINMYQAVLSRLLVSDMRFSNLFLPSNLPQTCATRTLDGVQNKYKALAYIRLRNGTVRWHWASEGRIKAHPTSKYTNSGTLVLHGYSKGQLGSGLLYRMGWHCPSYLSHIVHFDTGGKEFGIR